MQAQSEPEDLEEEELDIDEDEDDEDVEEDADELLDELEREDAEDVDSLLTLRECRGLALPRRLPFSSSSSIPRLWFLLPSRAIRPRCPLASPESPRLCILGS
jgi:hypothetical protein